MSAGLEYLGEYVSCPKCSVDLMPEQLGDGRKLARCWNCGSLLRLVQDGWPLAVADRAQVWQTDWYEQVAGRNSGRTRAELARVYAYPYLACPYCEQPNVELPGDQQYCVGCGHDLKKSCIVCGYALYVLDHFCPHCRNHQEQARLQLESLYWQRYNDGKRLAREEKWDEAIKSLDVFFNDALAGSDEETARTYRQAQNIYSTSIAPKDGGVGFKLYNLSLSQVKRTGQLAKRQASNQRLVKAGLIAGLVVALGILSTLSFGTWWALFIIVPVAALLILGLLLFILAGLGLV